MYSLWYRGIDETYFLFPPRDGDIHRKILRFQLVNKKICHVFQSVSSYTEIEMPLYNYRLLQDEEVVDFIEKWGAELMEATDASFLGGGTRDA